MALQVVYPLVLAETYPTEVCFGQSRDTHTQAQIQEESQLPVVFYFYGSEVSFWITVLNEKAALLWGKKWGAGVLATCLNVGSSCLETCSEMPEAQHLEAPEILNLWEAAFGNSLFPPTGARDISVPVGTCSSTS